MHYSSEKIYFSGGGITHIHTSFSKDGRYSLEVIGDYIHRNLKSGYFAIADHLTSPYKEKPFSSEIAGIKIRDMTVAAEAYNKKRDMAPPCVPGVEVNIMPGGLDIPNDVLSSIDYVVASRHFPWGTEEPQLFEENVLEALANPHVDVIGHIDRYAPGNVDWLKLMRRAKETKTIIEINIDSPPRLQILELMAKLELPLVLGTDFHSFNGWVKKSNSETSDEEQVTPLGMSLLKPVLSITKKLVGVGIMAEQIVNIKNYYQFIELLKTKKYERNF